MVGDQVFSGFGSGLKPYDGFLLHGAGELALQHALRAKSALRVEMDANRDLSIVAGWILDESKQGKIFDNDYGCLVVHVVSWMCFCSSRLAIVRNLRAHSGHSGRVAM